MTNDKQIFLNNNTKQSYQVQIPSNYNDKFKYMNIQNNTNYKLEILNNNIIIGTIQAVTNLTVVIPVDVNDFLTFNFTFQIQSSYSTNICNINFNTENLGYNLNNIGFDVLEINRKIYDQTLASNLWSKSLQGSIINYSNSYDINGGIALLYPNFKVYTFLSISISINQNSGTPNLVIDTNTMYITQGTTFTINTLFNKPTQLYLTGSGTQGTPLLTITAFVK